MIDLTEWESRLAIHDLQPHDPDLSMVDLIEPNRGRHQLAHILKGYNNPTLLDVGCGTAINFRVWQNLGVKCRYTGYDRSQECLNKAQSLCGGTVEFKRGHAQDLPFENGSFEIVVCRHILEYLSPDNAYRAIEEAVRVSSKEAILVFSLTPHSGPNHILERQSSGWRNTYAWLPLLQLFSRFSRKISREEVFTIGLDKPDTIIRLRV
jgi:ubiquinone/menaquinone biosynthesis C-methylase UbiE